MVCECLSIILGDHLYKCINILEPEFYIKILAHPVGKIRVIKEPKK